MSNTIKKLMIVQILKLISEKLFKNKKIRNTVTLFKPKKKFIKKNAKVCSPFFIFWKYVMRVFDKKKYEHPVMFYTILSHIVIFYISQFVTLGVNYYNGRVSVIFIFVVVFFLKIKISAWLGVFGFWHKLDQKLTDPKQKELRDFLAIFFAAFIFVMGFPLLFVVRYALTVTV